jgi:signal transduction histidine kinase
MSSAFLSFRRRITRSYVLLAAILVVLVSIAVTMLAFILYARGVSDAIPGARGRAADAAKHLITPAHPLASVSGQIIGSIGRSRFHVFVLDAGGHVIAQNEREGPPSPGRAIVIAIGRLVGLPHSRIPVQGGAVVISANFDRFGELLLWYWSIMLPIGALAVLAAWFIGRRITADAIGPLADVTSALKVIAAGDFSPQRLPSERTDLHELTAAYNEVAYSLATATTEQRHTEAQMRQFIADAGHELRTPLTIIMGYLDALRQGIVQGNEGTQRTYETMLDESRKMRSLIERLILLARLDRAPAARAPVPVDLADVVRKAVASLEPLANGRIASEFCTEPAIVTADESELFEAIKNVIDNALKYAPSSIVSVSVSRNGQSACVNVRDQGPGMDPQDAEHAFDRFYRGAARAEVEGSGLGLAIAKRAVERAGGKASIESAPGRGTGVTLCIPFSAN